MTSGIPSAACAGTPIRRCTGDALRIALKAVRPVLAKMPKKQRERACADIAAQMKGKTKRTGIYGAMNDAKYAAPGIELGKKIMARRNPNYKD